MAKSRAEIQKAYRQRLKDKDNNTYLKKERDRRRNTYVPNSQLSRKQRSIRNKKNRAYLKKYRVAKREVAAHIIEQGIEPNNVEQPSTSGYESQSKSQNRMVVRINFPNRSNGPRLRVSRELQKTKKEMKALRENYDNLKRKYRSTARAIQREKRKACRSPTTPRSKARKLMTGMKLTPDQESTVRKELIFANAVCDEIKSSSKKAPLKTKRLLKNLVVGSVLRKYRTLRKFAGRTGMCRNTLSKITNKNVDLPHNKRTREIAKHREKVIAFFERDDNSRNMPGKADAVKTKAGTQIQKRVLTDYLQTLYRKFISENPSTKLSLSSFCRIRPRHIILTSLITRDTCLCTKHQNMSLTLKAVKRQHFNTSFNGETMLENRTELIKDIEDKVHEDNITVVSQWKRVQTEFKGQKKSVMKVVNSNMTKKEFVEHVTKQSSEFEEHVSRIKTQYSQMKTLKENLPENHCIVHMDFSENYGCKSVEEIQSSYWNQTSVTLHLIVVYFKLNPSELLHKSFVYISDEMSHASSTVLTFVEKLIPDLLSLNPQMEHIHYWTDSPTSQYRNKVIFNAVANHKMTYNISATWNYWEAGHGKGPCDGLGGTVKRMADNAVKSGKVCIQDSDDFYAWTQSEFCTMNNVRFVFVEIAKCQEKAKALSQLKLKPVRGTMKVHAVKGKGNSMIAIRYTSCYCQECINPETSCKTWMDEITVNEDPSTSPMQTQDERNGSNKNPELVNVKETDYVAAKYLDKWYVGKVLDIDYEDNTVEISFLEHKKKAFQWPPRPDIIWVDHDQILCKVTQPTTVGKSKRMLQILPSDMKLVEEMFDHQ